MNDAMEGAEEIRARVAADLPRLGRSLRAWAEAHLIPPRLVELAGDPDGKTRVLVWLVTDHVGREDANYRVVYDPDAAAFGLEMTLSSGMQWYMGPHEGGFADVIEGM